MLHFEWDPAKDALNQRKHGIAFDEAQTAFFDDDAIEFTDPDHSEDEDRFILLGRSFTSRVLVVCHCYREDDRTVRIISARKATPKERDFFARRGRP